VDATPAPDESRTEADLLGERVLPKSVLWGIHTARAVENFPLAGRPVHRQLVRAYGFVKLACARVNADLGYLPSDVAASLGAACEEMTRGQLDEHVLVDALQGGAGTSTNMNVNEVLANRALALLGFPPGRYDVVSPSAHVNLHQSTNDTYPTALRVAAITGLRDLERAVVNLQEGFQGKETELSDVVKIGRTEMQDAVLITLGREMGAYAEAFSRDRWRIYKCEERLRFVNLGGTAVGTGLGAPRAFIFRATDVLRELTGFGLARAENLVDATQNADVFVEVSGILKALAATLLKVSGDLRLMSSGPMAGFGEVRLPSRQAGSSIMPGKVNPVIAEAASQVAMRVMAADSAIAMACSLGSLELNPFLPLVADELLGIIDLLVRACRMLSARCVQGLVANRDQCALHVSCATATATALVERLGYAAVERLVSDAALGTTPLREMATARGLLTGEEFDALISPDAVNRLGSRA
jgi:aspartate ammonia-lyase